MRDIALRIQPILEFLDGSIHGSALSLCGKGGRKGMGTSKALKKSSFFLVMISCGLIVCYLMLLRKQSFINTDQREPISLIYFFKKTPMGRIYVSKRTYLTPEFGS